MPGVRAIFHRENIGKIFRSVQGPGFAGIIDERRPPFEDDVIRYYGQYIALAVADTFETAKAAADAVRPTYAPERPNVDTDLKADDEPEIVATTFGMRERVQSQRGDADAAFANAPVKTRPDLRHARRDPQPHRAARDHRGVGRLDADAVRGHRKGSSTSGACSPRCSDCRKEQVRVITKFLGSGFGGKLWPWTHCPLAAAAARQLGKPVKLVVSRRMMFQTAGHRARTQQRVRLGATREGKLVSLQHDYVYHRSMLDAHHEDCGEATRLPVQRAEPSRDVRARQAQRGRAVPTCAAPARCPGSTRPSRR